ncbi:MAG: acetate kinase [Synergistaceae bacterium]|jgi:acetate kinase|nr:acetate kinase [Synergistaceae bacterium]
MKILVLNCGSSSLKYQLFDMDGESVLAKGLVERIGIAGSRVKHNKGNADAVVRETDIADHTAAIKIVLDLLLDGSTGVLKSLDELSAVGHRVVHGGEKNDRSVLVSDKVIRDIEECIYLAPLHNPANLMGIRAMQTALPNVPNVAVFDTAFHQTMPPKAYLYGIPYKYYEEDKVRRYSFHGTSHAFVSARAADILGRPIESLRLITCHLGNGSSLAAIQGGRSIDSSLGMGTTPGVLMGTRCGDVDISVVLYLMDKVGNVGKVSDILHKESGLLGISGVSSDLRDVEEAAAKGNVRAELAADILCTSVKKYIASYAAVMGGVDAIVFTAGIGENSDVTRREVTKGLEYMGVKLDAAKNTGLHGKEAIISADDSPVKILVVPTNEELMIARDTERLTK